MSFCGRLLCPYLAENCVFTGPFHGQTAAIAMESAGIPRMIIRICEKSLMYAFQLQRNLVDDYMVNFVLEHEIAH